MMRTGDQQEDVRMNARCVLMEFDLFIARHFEQWMTFVPGGMTMRFADLILPGLFGG
jgi:hypothetical protein